MQLNFLQENEDTKLKESKPTVASKAKQKKSAQVDLFGDLLDAAPPEKPAKKTSEKIFVEELEKKEELPQKAASAFKTISETAAMLDVPQHVLRFWESRFSQVKPLKMGGGRRYYRPEDIDILSKIKNLLYKQGYTIKGAKKAFGLKDMKTIEIANIPETNNSLLLTDKQKKQVSIIRQELMKLREVLRPYLSDTLLTS